MTRRLVALIVALVTAPFLSGFFWPQFFDLGWDEEVQLRDGRVIVVSLKFTYERLSSFSRYDNSILRNTEMSFDAGPPYGRVTQLFRQQQPVMLDQKDGQWYVALEERGGISLIRDEDWGPAQTSSGLRVGILRGARFEPTPIDFMPIEFDRPNFDLHYGPFGEIRSLDGERLTISQKNKRASVYPLGPEDRVFMRPNPSVYQQIKAMEKKN